MEGLDGDDRIVVDTGTDAPVRVDPGMGRDTVIAHSLSDIRADTGGAEDDADLIDMSALTQTWTVQEYVEPQGWDDPGYYRSYETSGWVTAGDGDTVIGASAGAIIHARILGTADYRGGDGEDIVTIGDHPDVDVAGATILGGAGNDLLRDMDNDDNANFLSGGDGDDTLWGNGDHWNVGQPSETDLHAWRTEDAVDTLDGGAGNDHIRFSDGDLISTGEGADRLTGWIDGSAVTEISDFVAGEDRMELVVDTGSGGGAPPTPAEFAARFEFVEQDGDTVVNLDGQQVMVLHGTTGATVSVADDRGAVFDTAGNPAPDLVTDIRLTMFQSVST